MNSMDPTHAKMVTALVLTGYGLNCDYETAFALRAAGALAHRIHINEVISGPGKGGIDLSDFQILVFGGGFSWADDHGAGVIMAAKMRRHLGDEIRQFIEKGKLIIGICNGFQCLVNLGLLPGFDRAYDRREVALTYNDSGNFIDDWVRLTINPQSPCVFTRGLDVLDLPVRHGEGKFYAPDAVLTRLAENNQVVLRYADTHGNPAQGRFPENPNGSLSDIAGICDPTGRVFGLMPHPEAFTHFTNHPDWPLRLEAARRMGQPAFPVQGDGLKVFQNAVAFMREQAAG